MDERLLREEIDAVAGSHASLVAWLYDLAPVDPATPSLLPGWTVGHVLTHIARNGDSHLDLLAGRPQYPSFESRNADIEAGAGRAWDELLDDVERSCHAVDEAYASHDDWSGTVAMAAGPRPATMAPLLRQREVEVHRVDLGLGYRFGDLPVGYVRRDLRIMEMLWRARRPMGLTPLPDAALALPPSTRLAWMMGRTDVSGLAPAGIF